MMHEWNGSPDCRSFRAVVESVLDGECPASQLDSPHTAACESCRAAAASAAMLASYRPTPLPPVDLAARIVPIVLADRRRGRAFRRAVVAFAASLAASILLATLAVQERGPDRPPLARTTANPATPTDLRPPPIEDSFRSAGSAFVSLTKRAAAESLAPARNLLAGIDLPDAPSAATPAPSESRPATSTVAPIANTAKRAIDLFIRDFGSLAPIANRKS